MNHKHGRELRFLRRQNRQFMADSNKGAVAIDAAHRDAPAAYYLLRDRVLVHYPLVADQMLLLLLPCLLDN